LSGAVYVPGSGGSVTSNGDTITVTAGTPGQWINAGSLGSANYSSDWTTNDFLGHYFGGSGKAVDLSNIGLDDEYLAHPSVKTLTGAYISALENLPYSSFWAPEAEIEYTDVTNTIFSVGKSALYAACGCRGPDCFFRFTIRDRFEDPIHLGVEIPFGVPYDIRYEWSKLTRRGKR
jgi:hypothetical protein